MGFYPIYEWLFGILSGEWMLKFRPNGGEVIFARSIQVALFFFALALLAINLIDSSHTWSTEQLRKDVVEKLPWLGAIFTGVYFSLYVRFQQQWNYLASVYNQIKMAEARTGGTQGQAGAIESINQWKAAFIEDAGTVHLATKKTFAFPVWRWGHEQRVREAFGQLTPEGEEVITKLLNRIERIHKWPKPEVRASEQHSGAVTALPADERTVYLNESGVKKLRDADAANIGQVKTTNELIRYSGDNVIVTVRSHGTTYLFKAEDVKKIE